MTFSARIVEIKDLKNAEREMLDIGVHMSGVHIMADKAVFRAVKLKDVPVVAANILKQDMLSRGGEAATSHGTIDHSAEKTDVLMLGSISQYKGLCDRLRSQQFGLPLIAEEIELVLLNEEKCPAPILGMEFGKRTYIMGILNVTPDSFSDGGMFKNRDEAVCHAAKMTGEGADIIDIGGESTRPGALPVDERIEIQRTIPVINGIVGAQHVAPLLQQNAAGPIISIDTRKSKVAETAVKAGAKMINDISGLRHDPEMAQVAAQYRVPVIIMHSKGDPENMQKDPRYDYLMTEILRYFEKSMGLAVKSGIKEENIIVDPGIGFGKTLEHNIEILRRLGELRCFGRPVCIGASRKSMIGAILNEPDPQKREEGSASIIPLAISKKVDIIRVHNAGMASKVARISDTIYRRS